MAILQTDLRLSSGHLFRPSSRQAFSLLIISALPAPSGPSPVNSPAGVGNCCSSQACTPKSGDTSNLFTDGTPLTRIDGMMIIGMFGGCFAAALWANNVKLRMPKSRVRIMQAVVGGMIAGFGARGDGL